MFQLPPSSLALMDAEICAHSLNDRVKWHILWLGKRSCSFLQGSLIVLHQELKSKQANKQRPRATQGSQCLAVTYRFSYYASSAATKVLQDFPDYYSLLHESVKQLPF